jgi:protein-S-isoprenylcysteine O-methyltransferase Ste14
MTLPVLVIGVVASLLAPSKFAIPVHSDWLTATALLVLAIGLIGWGSSVAMILAKVPRGELITGGPYAIVKHPLYTSVGLLVLPAAGVLLDTWLGAAIGATVYIASRRFAPEEEAVLADAFGARWDAYARSVRLRWV